MRFRVGVLGATGYIATAYRREIREAGNAEIVALCARRRELLEAAAVLDGASCATANWREVVEHPDVNLVIVATPDALHHDAVMACAEQRKHVVCEKPVGFNVREAHEMWAAVRGAKLAHFVPFWTRYIPVFVRAKAIVAEGALGKIRAVVYRWHNPRPSGMPFTWRDDAKVSAAGSIADVGSHAYDTIRWIVGEPAVRVLAHAGTLSPNKPQFGALNLGEALELAGRAAGGGPATRRGTAFDYAAISFVLGGGAVGSLLLSHAPFLRKGLAPELELHGTEASLAVDRVRSSLTLTRGNDALVPETVPNPGVGNRFANHVFPALEAQITRVPIDCPTLEDGWQVQLFTDAAALSAKTGRWVDLAELNPESARTSRS
jgi:predicted dehydrogenase